MIVAIPVFGELCARKWSYSFLRSLFIAKDL